VAGTGVIIRPAASTAAALQAFTIQLPIPGSGLHLGSDLQNLAVLYHVWQTEGGQLVGGLLPYSALTVVDGNVSFDTRYFGAYQVTIMTSKVEEQVEVVTEEPIRNASNVTVMSTTGVVEEETIAKAEALPAVELDTPYVAYLPAVRKVRIAAKQKSGFTLSSCKVELRKSPDVYYGQKKETGTSLEAEFFIPDLSAISVVGQVSCVDEHGRLGVSPWSAPVKIPVVNTVLYYSAADKKVTVKSDLMLTVTNFGCKAYLTNNSSMTGGQSSAVTDTEWHFAVNNTSPVTYYGRFSCKDALGNVTYSKTSVGLTVYGGMTISPSFINLTGPGGHQFTVKGGVPPYQWSVRVPADPNTTSYYGVITSSGYYSTSTPVADLVRVTDSTGAVATSLVNFVFPMYFNYPDYKVRLSKTVDLSISGGLPPFTYSVTQGGGSLSVVNVNTVRYTAPSSGSSATVRAVDSLGTVRTVPIALHGSGQLDPGFGALGEAMLYPAGQMSYVKDMSFAAGGANIALGGTLDPYSGYNGILASQVDKVTGYADSSWGTYGDQISNFGSIDAKGEAMTVMSDGSMVVVGKGWGTAVPDLDVTILKITSAGAVDTGFGGGLGFVQIDLGSGESAFAVKEMTVSSVPKILVAGTDGSSAFIARLNTDGTLDTSFNGTGLKSIGGMTIIYDMHVTASNEIVVVGQSAPSGYFTYARISSGGTFSGPYDQPYLGIALRIKGMSDGGVIIAGGEQISGADYRWTALRLDSSFNPVASFGTAGTLSFDYGSGTDMVHGIAVSSTGKIYLVGSQSEDVASGGAARILRLQASTGAVDTAWASSGMIMFTSTSSSVRYNDILLDEGTTPRIFVLGEPYNSFTSFIHAYIP
jgi:uncharacterized delta-60 repeat protein